MTGPSASESTPASTPVLRIVRGTPNDDELAALLVVVAAATQRPASAEVGSRPATWAAYWRGLRRPFEPGAGAWKRSTWPQ